jgi:hypothetical protein
VTRTELREVLFEIKTEILGIKTDILGIKTDINKLRNSLWLNVAVPCLTLIVSLVIHYIFR